MHAVERGTMEMRRAVVVQANLPTLFEPISS